jgi:hypothetical protein
MGVYELPVGLPQAPTLQRTLAKAGEAAAAAAAAAGLQQPTNPAAAEGVTLLVETDAPAATANAAASDQQHWPAGGGQQPPPSLTGSVVMPGAPAAAAAAAGGGGHAQQGRPHRLRLLQILSPSLVSRAHVWGSNLTLRPTWTCVDAPYFEAPGVLWLLLAAL